VPTCNEKVPSSRVGHGYRPNSTCLVPKQIFPRSRRGAGQGPRALQPGPRAVRLSQKNTSGTTESEEEVRIFLSTGCEFLRRSDWAESRGNVGFYAGRWPPAIRPGKINYSTARGPISFNIHDGGLFFTFRSAIKTYSGPVHVIMEYSHFCGFQPNPNAGETRNK
jgi:hypothetical protein